MGPRPPSQSRADAAPPPRVSTCAFCGLLSDTQPGVPTYSTNSAPAKHRKTAQTRRDGAQRSIVATYAAAVPPASQSSPSDQLAEPREPRHQRVIGQTHERIVPRFRCALTCAKPGQRKSCRHGRAVRPRHRLAPCPQRPPDRSRRTGCVERGITPSDGDVQRERAQSRLMASSLAVCAALNRSILSGRYRG